MSGAPPPPPEPPEGEPELLLDDDELLLDDAPEELDELETAGVVTLAVADFAEILAAAS